ncbi:MAG: transcription antitermination factor NusB [Pseudomonadales bacterium]|nr:transcription antitermination factor NusB [Pseudomonadales bacterium]MBO6563866.1 transcription antitermination factor NusB [Pseudomonadales bacterium]MBO6597413.1 transcription antitermination factor NusB [Pseudomonadales bacterium]MBO6657255.1 transcription antitermination factor NusB [Pseudomonadales bacterium]MBO6703092.1 transcription antitermination factor NusB [Pseudomonadales bacterium]
MNPSAAARSRTRQFLVQALYQAQLTGVDYIDVLAPFINDHNMKRADLEYFREVIRGIGADEQALIELIESKSDRKFVELDPVEKGILLMSAFELRSRIDIPYRVVINEAIELAKSFGATDSYRFVNTVLDELSRELRKLEQHDSQ